MAQKMIELLMKDGGVANKDLPYFADGLSRIIKANVSREKLKSEIKNKVGKAFEKVENNMKKMSKEDMVKTMKEAYGLI